MHQERNESPSPALSPEDEGKEEETLRGVQLKSISPKVVQNTKGKRK